MTTAVGVQQHQSLDVSEDLQELSELIRDYHVITEGEQQLYNQHKDEGKLRLTQETMSKLKPGDVVELSYYKLPHYVVVESVRTQPDKPADFVIIDAIHYGRPNLLTPNRIIRETFELKLNTEKCWLHVFPPASCYPSQTVLQRARSRLNEQEHELVSNNATMFALWCKIESPTHRQSCRVPIYISDKHQTHSVKPGDHIDIKCVGNRMLHAEITCVETLPDEALLITIIAQSSRWIKYIHESEHLVTESVNQVIGLPDPGESILSEICERALRLNGIFYPMTEQSLSICKLLLSAGWRADEWKRVAFEQSSATNLNAAGIITRKKSPDLLKPGDVIHLKGVYRVVIDVKSEESGTRVRTVQYCVGPQAADEGSRVELKCRINKKEEDSKLCVHNQVHEDCELYGGGRDKPTHSTEKVTDVKQIKRGCVISFRYELGYYKHAVVTTATAVQEDCSRGDSEADKTKLDCELITYVLNPSFSTEQFKVTQSQVRIDIGVHDVHIVKYSIGPDRIFSAEKVIERAYSRLGEREHNLLWNSDRDFARWCSIDHGSNREQCRIDISSAKDLESFGRGHIKFLKLPRLYTHDALMRECRIVEGCDEIVQVRLYENNHHFRCVRKETLHIGEEELIQRVRYEGFSGCISDSEALDELMGVTFLNADDDQMGWTRKAKKCGSRVTSHDFCHWLKVKRRNKELKDIGEFFGTQLDSIQKAVSKLEKFGAHSLCPGESIFVEDKVSRSYLRQFDHIVLERKVNGKVEKVHFILLDWDAESSTGVGVTYEYPVEKEKMGFKELNGFIRVSGPGELQKVVHNTELDWAKIDAKFADCLGAENYHLLFNNCEHFVNFLIYGRFTSLQLSDWALKVTSACPSFAVSFFKSVGKFAKLINRVLQVAADVTPAVPDGKTFWSEGLGLAFIVGFSVIEALVLEFRRATTGMPDHEYRQRVKSLLCSVGSSVVGLLVAMGVGTTTWSSLTGIAFGAAGIGYLAPRVPVIFQNIFRP